MENKRYPHVRTHLFKDYIAVPEVIRKSSGILINGKRFKALLFTTDIALIMNNDADAIMAVYPFTPHPAIIQAITSVSTIPIMAGIAGGTTQGVRSANMALFSEAHGCKAVVINAPTPIETIEMINEMIDIPIILTVVSEYTDIEEKIKAGVDIINVSGASKTKTIVKQIRKNHPDMPIIATGGPTNESILETIEAGANAITYTPPSNGELFSRKMMDYREREKDRFEEE
ncbi:putative enzyme with TIM-barrel fold protein [Alkalibacterium sp. AK22]|uniref:hydrolase n=1 Tax=Alkalibacterium sp. AK22 TaxID=1229520 RepID=UPI00044F5E30|nr:hydrolase [Alkalibacterium sp. AK22]EXJ22999.1 putative enzyme with TIM-barrel fold protein [Alkalibacterium sp. AK22]